MLSFVENLFDSMINILNDSVDLLLKKRSIKLLTEYFQLNEGMLSKDKLEAVLPSLVETVCGWKNLKMTMKKRKRCSDEHDEFIREFVKPCFVQLCLALSDKDDWHVLYDGVVSCAKEENVGVRIQVLGIIQVLFEEIGEEFIALLPQTLPVLAEFLEDDDIEVKKQAIITAKKLERISGEDLSKLLVA